jgi:hypothetical protein
MRGNKKMFILQKVFDCQDMPDDIKEIFFNQNECGNDCLVYYTVNWLKQAIEEDGTESPDCYDSSNEEKLDNWLIENGALNNELIIISHWW